MNSFPFDRIYAFNLRAEKNQIGTSANKVDKEAKAVKSLGLFTQLVVLDFFWFGEAPKRNARMSRSKTQIQLMPILKLQVHFPL